VGEIFDGVGTHALYDAPSGMITCDMPRAMRRTRARQY
jgi:hypothetical protein